MEGFPTRPMLPTLVAHIPAGDEWLFEPKLDGYRAQLIWTSRGISFFSRNLHDVTSQFPDVIAGLLKHEKQYLPFVPFVADGELAVLTNEWKACFRSMQKRVRTTKDDHLKKLIDQSPAAFIGFDLLVINGQDIRRQPFFERRSRFEKVFDCPLEQKTWRQVSCFKVRQFDESGPLWQQIARADAEGIVAKRRDSLWESGKRTMQWLKIKNPRFGHFIITAYEKANGFFHVGLMRDGVLTPAGLFTNGLGPEERGALETIIRKNKCKEDQDFIYIPPGICVELSFLEWSKSSIRQPKFERFRFDIRWEDCQWEQAASHELC